MTHFSRQHSLMALACTLLTAASVPGLAAPPVKPAPPASGAAPRVLILSGGYDTKHNQVAIESNVRYVARLLPPGATTRVLFTDGSRTTKNVLYEDAPGREHYRTPQLPRLDGPNTLPQIKAEFQTLAAGPANRPALLYVTGHGSPSRQTLDNNVFDLWDNGELSVRELAAQMKTLPVETPLTVVMVECFSGSFGNLLFENGDPKAPLTGRDFCGFFASIAPRPAAGCTPAVNEADYHDFTGYFFSALSGQSRVGQRVTGADYNKDGRVGMDEAFAYSLIYDDSIDNAGLHLRRVPAPLCAGSEHRLDASRLARHPCLGYPRAESCAGCPVCRPEFEGGQPTCGGLYRLHQDTYRRRRPAYGASDPPDPTGAYGDFGPPPADFERGCRRAHQSPYAHLTALEAGNGLTTGS